MGNKNLFGEEDTTSTSYYDWSRMRDYVKSLGMEFDDVFAHRIDSLAFELKLMPEQLFPLGVEHIRRVKFLFNPRMYGWKTRLRIALHFLNPFGSK